MAAWKGCLDNVKYLIEDVGCDINAYSKQEFSYGKTAIFFALTQCRPDVTEFLLEKGAKVTIVNNKGQSVLSLAASHFKDSETNTIVLTIQKLEKEQGEWWDFRASHSDGFEYGDQDPRFFNDRPLKDTDVVTPLAINPTTKGTRKGGFLKRNPDAEKWTNACRGRKSENSKKKTRKKAPLPVLSLEEQGKIDHAWDTLLELSLPISLSSETLARESLLEILRLSDKERSSWIPQATIRLMERFGTDDSIEVIEKTMSHPDSISQRQGQLLTKVLCRLKSGEKEEQEDQKHNDESQSQKGSSRGKTCFVYPNLWKLARSEVEGLCISCLEETDSPILTLPNSPIFVDTPDVLQHVVDTFSSSKLVAIDTEWHTRAQNGSTKPKVALSTLQIAFWDSKHAYLSAFVIDFLKQEANEHSEYHQIAQTLVGNLLEACRDETNQELPLVLGFAISHDLPVLERFLKDDDESTGKDSDQESLPCYTRVLDLQSLLMAAEMQREKRKSGPPGLKACVSNYSLVPLSKDCQCSDWGLRPLTKAQLDYAGLDAAILLVLLAEQSKEGTP
mmetsp:Transcript_15652/g.32376  ORF Transcript_15652/g.32376 Transcript_15652/m.32376 type:complete len:561 (-) Transcript_15652:1821-3503(-)